MYVSHHVRVYTLLWCCRWCKYVCQMSFISARKQHRIHNTHTMQNAVIIWLDAIIMCMLLPLRFVEFTKHHLSFCHGKRKSHTTPSLPVKCGSSSSARTHTHSHNVFWFGFYSLFVSCLSRPLFLSLFDNLFVGCSFVCSWCVPCMKRVNMEIFICIFKSDKEDFLTVSEIVLVLAYITQNNTENRLNVKVVEFSIISSQKCRNCIFPLMPSNILCWKWADWVNFQANLVISWPLGKQCFYQLGLSTYLSIGKSTNIWKMGNYYLTANICLGSI